MEATRENITRAAFKERFGLEPDPDVIGMCFYTPSGVLVQEFVFTDEIMPFGKSAQIAALKKLAAL